ncbi:GlxA family transcriptional regulator [Oryzibacter oryziterrae]|nr:helix-turn-helix domain-containing protein [Oryzibacter oryziterrae]
MQRHIEILAFPNVQILDVTGPMQVFSTANDMAAAKGQAPHYLIEVVGEAAETRASSGLSFASRVLPDLASPLDTLIVAGGRGVNAAAERRTLVDWVRARAKRARRVASVCSGAFLLAEAGLLDGRRAVTHWSRIHEFSTRFPQVFLEADPIFIREGKVWTSAGVTAGIDLALALVEEDLGHAVALAVARVLVVFLKRPGGQSQYSATLALQAGDGRFDALHAWINDNLKGDLTLARLAAEAGMSERSFSRHYRAATGKTPVRAVEDLRTEAARRLLEQGYSVGEVARRAGFGSDETMRRAFVKLVGVAPQAYRERFCRV